MSDTEYTPLLDGSATLQAARKRATPLPRLQLFNVFFIQFAEPVTATVVYPFIVQLVRDTGITGGDEARTGYYAGLIESLFYAAEALTTLQWGRLADRIGRKPPLVAGMLGLTAVMVGFGLSTEFVSLVIFRSLQGVFNGNIGITKAVLAEITDSSNSVRVFSMIPLCWGLGVTLAPMVGGILSHPATKWPETFGKIAFFQSYPYFLPCIVAGMAPLGACIFAAIFMKETLVSSGAEKKTGSIEEGSALIETDGQLISSETTAQDEPATLSSLMTPRILIVLANYAFTVFAESASGAIIPLLYATPISYGGLGLSSSQIGTIMSFAGIMLCMSSFFFFPLMARKFGLTNLYRIGFASHLVTQTTYSLMNMLARRNGYVDGYVIAALTVQVMMANFSVMTFTCMFMHINEAAPSRRALGTLNGLAQTVATTCRIFAPITASSLFSLSQQHNLLGGNLVYYIMLVVAMCGLFVSTGLPQLEMESA